MATLACLVASLSPQARAAYVNTTAGGALRPGVYGRIEIGKASPPPVIYDRPVIASSVVPAPGAKPVYLYVPPGQARKWPKYCGKYQACSVPVYFVRMDNSPSRLGKWKSRGEAGDRAARMASRAPQGQNGPPGYRD